MEPPLPMSLTGSFQPADQIVIPVQGTDREYYAQQWAVEFAAAIGVPVKALHVGDGSQDDDPEVFRYIQKLAEKHSVEITTQHLHGDVVDELAAELAPRDLCVIGTRRLSHAYHVGSVAAGLIEKAPCPVQVVRLE
jgi:nucleotide-binding universal stress UspA family protein